MNLRLKYLSIFVAVVALFATSCTEENEPNTDNAFKTKPTVGIVTSSVADESFVLTLTPSAAAETYAYAVMKGTNNSTPDALTFITSGKVTGSISQGAFVVSAKPSATIDLKSLTPATEYEIFAVAITGTGLVGDVAKQSLRTPDTNAPTLDLKTSAIAPGKVTLMFSETVKIAEGAKIKVGYYYAKSSELDGDGTEYIDAADVTVSGKTATFSYSALPGCTMVFVSYAAGTFVDMEGLPIAKMESYADWFSPDPIVGFGNMLPEVYWSLSNDGFKDYGKEFVDWKAFKIVYNSDIAIYKGIGGPAKIKYTTATKTTVFTVPVIVAGDKKSFSIALPEEPIAGTQVSVDLPKDAIYNYYGNGINAYAGTTKMWIYAEPIYLKLQGKYILNGLNSSGAAATAFEVQFIGGFTAAQQTANFDNKLIGFGWAGQAWADYQEPSFPLLYDKAANTLTLKVGEPLATDMDFSVDEPCTVVLAVNRGNGYSLKDNIVGTWNATFTKVTFEAGVTLGALIFGDVTGELHGAWTQTKNPVFDRKAAAAPSLNNNTGGSRKLSVKDLTPVKLLK